MKKLIALSALWAAVVQGFPPTTRQVAVWCEATTFHVNDGEAGLKTSCMTFTVLAK
jgi:hypothetical protein